ncbi:cation:proton antiporter domain-containing protein [Halodesulfovibrio marinisediminis]|uniref:Glutathione-regulated potassium-efflux system protein KefB n=1 Tax=Halodesulfovibrio marinisediminis DSM 17456 TaxID=1121457 RepID=A0A1N6FM41_9BACT|nr:cation:proton antiporter [Halodesulfovibrio marinisediminis]SIN96322.1 glutathione-regulated potassium-efflux system protein KefB [Halodesulfovibrio marinisediminis DSM 17456]
MDMSSVLFAIILFLAAAAFSIIVFERLGFGVILGSIVAGTLIGPHTPGPVAFDAVEELQSVAELGVVLFLFTVGLEMRPKKFWAMRRMIFGLGSAQMVVTAVMLFFYLFLFVSVPWKTAIIVGLAFAMSSTAIVISILGDRGELGSEHGKTIFAILMAQDLWVIPIMAFIPILAHTQSQFGIPLWEKSILVVGVLTSILVVGRYVLPAVLNYCARRRQMGVFGLALFLAVIYASWAVEHVGISMTLGAFLLGMILSASDFRYQIEAIVAPFKSTLMGLFFVAVGMSINVEELFQRWDLLLLHVPIILFIKSVVLIGLVPFFGISRSAVIRTGLYLSQVGELAFVLLGTSFLVGLLNNQGYTLVMLIVVASMSMTPIIVKYGDWLARRFDIKPTTKELLPITDLNQHVVIIGYDVGAQLIDFLLEEADVPHVAIDHDYNRVCKGKQLGRKVYFGNVYSYTMQEAVSLRTASTIYINSKDAEHAKALAITLQRLYPHVDLYVRVHSLADKDELLAMGIKHVHTDYIESTLAHGRNLLKGLGIPEDTVNDLSDKFRHDDYQLIRYGYVTSRDE